MATVKHYFVVGPSGQSVHLKGPFESREAAAEFVKRNRPHAPCWIMPAEYFGLVDHTPLNADGQRNPKG